MGHFGGTPQPFSREAKEWLAAEVLNKRITVTLHRLDQYNRVIGSVSYWPDGFFSRLLSILLAPFTTYAPGSLSLNMVRAGLATVYENAGAEYGRLSKAQLQVAEGKAREQKIGMWAQADFVHPSDYKKMRVINSAMSALDAGHIALKTIKT
jgi:endonuclease YncB( thermonuclease family)